MSLLYTGDCGKRHPDEDLPVQPCPTSLCLSLRGVEQPFGFGVLPITSPHPHASPQVLDYDYYGAYSRERHREYTYNQLLADEYTFDFPPHHNIVSEVWGHIWSWRGWWRPQSPSSTLPLDRAGEAQGDGNSKLGETFHENEAKRMACAWKAQKRPCEFYCCFPKGKR